MIFSIESSSDKVSFFLFYLYFIWLILFHKTAVYLNIKYFSVMAEERLDSAVRMQSLRHDCKSVDSGIVFVRTSTVISVTTMIINSGCTTATDCMQLLFGYLSMLLLSDVSLRLSLHNRAYVHFVALTCRHNHVIAVAE